MNEWPLQTLVIDPAATNREAKNVAVRRPLDPNSKVGSPSNRWVSLFGNVLRNLDLVINPIQPTSHSFLTHP